ncbi:hypothetical protein BH11PLA2_BH11PLA2_01290 [soil metagenome]
MRSYVFRFLAAIIASLFGWVISINYAKMSYKELIGGSAIGIVFAAYAALGDNGSDWLLSHIFGIGTTDKPKAVSQEQSKTEE